jgi:sodium-dependent dicarboxylate transporter 2/3/5
LTKNEILAALIVFGMIAMLSLRSFIPELKAIDKTGIILVSTVLFFVFKILDLEDLEGVPWNIILLFGGAMSMGFCLWETGAAKWLAINWLAMFKDAHWFIFVMSISLFVMMMTNFIMNVAAIAISLPVALVIAPYLHVSPDIILYSSLVVAGMPFLLLVGAAPNAIAYNSGQFTSGEFFFYGIPASILLMIGTGLAVWLIWPLMGMPVTIP